MAEGDKNVHRRNFLKTAGATAATATTVAMAGCSSDGGDDTPTDDGNGGDGGDGGNGGDGGDGGNGGSDLSGTLVYARGDHPENYDPQQTTSGEVAKVTNQIFDQLIQFQPGSGGALEDGLAKSDGWSLSGTTATVQLKEGITYHDGSEFTAEDVKATIRRFTDSEYQYYLGQENASGYAGFTFGNWIESIDASDDYEVTFTLTQKYAPFLRNLAMFAAAILSKDQITSLDDQTQLGTNPIGTGPFSFEELDNANQRVLLAGNGEYHGDGPNVEQVVFRTIGQNSSRAQSVVNGESHITDNLGAESSGTIEDSDSAQVKSKPGINTGYMAFNMARVEAFRDRKVRRAVSLAVNTEAIVNDIYQGFAVQTGQPLPEGVMGRNPDVEPYPTDKDQAQSLLEEAGASDLSFELATFSNPRGYNPSPIQTANQVKSDLEEVGMSVTINQFSTFSSYLEYTSAGKHDACFLGWYTDNADPDNFMYVLLDPKVSMDAVPDGQDWVSFDTEGYSTLNVGGWANTDYMQLVRDAQRTYDESTRKQKYQQASQLAHDEAPWVFVDHAKTIRAINEAVVSDSFTVSSVGGPFLELVELQ